jgi:hypothetical protein
MDFSPLMRRRFGAPAAIAAALLSLAPPVLDAAPGESIALPVATIEARLRGPIEIIEVAQARPKIEGDRSARVVLAGFDGEPDMIAHWKPVAPPGKGFNNEPRYVLAAYRLQSLFLDECEYVVPPVALRALSVEEYERLRGAAPATLRDTSSVLFLLSYWLADVTNRDPWDRARFDADPRYAHHWGNVNILTHLIEHKDANLGNLLISVNPESPRVFSIDNDVAFNSDASDRGDQWRHLQVDRLPQRTIERLRALTRETLDTELGVLAEFQVANGILVPVEPGKNLGPRTGLRSKGDRVQLGLSSAEIAPIMRRIDRLLTRVDRGELLAIELPDFSGTGCAAAGGQ